LLIEHKITLCEALTGVNFVITHLDGTKIRIKNEPGQVIKPDDLKTVPEKGLPFHKSPFRFGNLFIKFTVTFPDSIPAAKLAGLRQALPAPAQAAAEDADMDAETFMLSAFEESQRNTKAAGGTQDDSDEEEEDPRGGGGQRVQCAQQ
jgi:DnaJ family protein A protein 2